MRVCRSATWGLWHVPGLAAAACGPDPHRTRAYPGLVTRGAPCRTPRVDDRVRTGDLHLGKVTRCQLRHIHTSPSPWSDSNGRPHPYRGCALPLELQRRKTEGISFPLGCQFWVALSPWPSMASGLHPHVGCQWTIGCTIVMAVSSELAAGWPITVFVAVNFPLAALACLDSN